MRRRGIHGQHGGRDRERRDLNGHGERQTYAHQVLVEMSVRRREEKGLRCHRGCWQDDIVAWSTHHDDLTTTLVQQCYQSQHTIQRFVETAGDNEAMLFEALSMNDEMQKVLSKYEEMKKPIASEHTEQRVVIPIATEHEDSATVGNEDALVRKPAGSRARSGGEDDILDDLDEMIFGKKGGSSSQEGSKMQDPKKDDLINF